MSGLLLAQNKNLVDWLFSPLAWGLALGALGLWLMLTPALRWRMVGKVIAVIGLIVLGITLPKLSSLETLPQWGEQLVFWMMAALAVGCAGAAISVDNPVYTAIWFAGSLLGVSGLFLFQHAQFLAGATVVVYAGAIVVTFLFVLMLANPEGHARYDRISWSKFAIPAGVLGAVALLAVIAFSYAPPNPRPTNVDVQSADHMVHVGTELFAKHLVEVEVAGTLLLVALVGAIAIVIQGKATTRVAPLENIRSDSGDARR